MKVVQKQLLALVRLALHPSEDIPSCLQGDSIDWEALKDEAVRHSVPAIAFRGAQVWKGKQNDPDVGLDRQLVMRWVSLVEKVKKRNLLLNEQTAFVTQAFEKDNFRSTVMKGQGNTLLYKTDTDDLSLFRSPGDIDVWVEGGFKKVNDYVQSVKPTREVNELEIQFHIMRQTSVEVHYRPFIMRNPFKNRRLQRYFNDCAEACFTNEQTLPVEQGSVQTYLTTPAFNLIHQMVHIHLHLFTEGIGLRQLMDYYFLLLNTFGTDGSTVKIDQIRAVVKSLGLVRFAKALMWILHHEWGLPLAVCPWEPSEKDGVFLLEEVVKTGNFGHQDEENIARKQKKGFGFWNIFIRNLSFTRFDRWDWFWGPIWRVYHGLWRKWHGYK